ncbi:hypothetical protein H6A18_09545 [Collinsella tanakaei]|uniref:hypothetical protein n=1 Tax=Collinsella tanakaei TaxID=626935 RepID=UPI00195A89A8|nr:hypothetical protein [Collinsella tanakaei]MBM6756745.1 hypothetical protein [Collinsella tanakaei]
MEIKPKITYFMGERYRSMAEAKTAESLHRLGLAYDYEAAAARGPQYIGGQFTPDFFVPEMNMFMEVAGVWDERHRLNSAQFIRDMSLDGWTGDGCPCPARFARVDGDGYVWAVFPDGWTDHAYLSRCTECGRLIAVSESQGWACPLCGAYDGDRYLAFMERNLFDLAGVKRYGGR